MKNSTHSLKPVSHHYAALIFALIITMASIAGYFFIEIQVGNQASKTSAAFAQVAAEQSAAVVEQAASSSLASTADGRALLETYLIPESQTVFFIEQVEGVAQQSGAKISIATITEDDLSQAATGTIGHIQAHISIGGSWDEAMRALHIIEDMPYALTIDNVALHAEGGGVWDVEFTVTGLIVK